MSHVTHMSESRLRGSLSSRTHRYESCHASESPLKYKHVTSHIDESRHTHTWMSHVSEGVSRRSHISMSHVTYQCVLLHTNASCHRESFSLSLYLSLTLSFSLSLSLFFSLSLFLSLSFTLLFSLSFLSLSLSSLWHTHTREHMRAHTYTPLTHRGGLPSSMHQPLVNILRLFLGLTVSSTFIRYYQSSSELSFEIFCYTHTPYTHTHTYEHTRTHTHTHTRTLKATQKMHVPIRAHTHTLARTGTHIHTYTRSHCSEAFICAMTHPYAPWLIYMRYDSFICAMTQSHMPRLIHMWRD